MRLRFTLKKCPYTLLFIALFSVFIINLLPGEAAMKSHLSLLFQIGAGINLLAGKNRLLLLLPVLAGTVIEFFFNDNPTTASFAKLLYLYFFVLISMVVLRQVMFARKVCRELVFSALCGFLLIGYMGFFLFSSIELYAPGSFKGISAETPLILNDLFYYSFISILTVGYGDIVAVSWPARNATILVVLVGYIYSLVFIARVVSDFTSRKL
ncbi:two pore domain potassium channel family protein [Salmonella enterica]|nr:two pore domain potassium channel family protein [Salmonella enterica]EIP6686936.1 two pore domain potassium channel family protein [Salmonella enterica subsp. enterica serovar Javiana]EIP6741545.1 two pore domain potassium channel family protein [Salmonella enterica subsp. enterica serovar Javiana]EIQ4669993.1 two pore domain potassium channel family protein [Salmonella enterica subsp. enterica serovar Javiana]EIR2402387.1 two pore domain potassium channel family protein [Salmonella enteric